MTIYAGASPITPQEVNLAQRADYLCFAGPSERPAALALFAIEEQAEGHTEDTAMGTRFESRNGVDYLCFEIPSPGDILGGVKHAELFFTAKALVVVAEGGTHAIPRMQKLMEDWHGEAPSPQRALNLFFSCLFYGDSAFLQDLEDEVEELEELATHDEPPKDCILKISEMRRKLLALKRYYEAVFDLLEDMEENQNGFFTPEQLRALHIYTNRADRLAGTVLNLREYVVQVREVYQNQIDVSLNKTMKLFTVLSAIFFPLTLIVGWYGMNLRMPEYTQPFAYPFVIALSVFVVILCIVVFRKKRWF